MSRTEKLDVFGILIDNNLGNKHLLSDNLGRNMLTFERSKDPGRIAEGPPLGGVVRCSHGSWSRPPG